MKDVTLVRRRIKRSQIYREVEALVLAYDFQDRERTDLLLSSVSFFEWCTANVIDLTELRNISRTTVVGYGRHLNDEFLVGKYVSTGAIITKLSGINKIMSCVLLDDWLPVNSVDDCGITGESIIPKSSKKFNKDSPPDNEDLAGYLLDLQKTLGITIREALILDLEVGLKEARKTNKLSVSDVNVGRVRKVPCSESSIKAIANGIASKRLQKFLQKPWGYDDYLKAHNKIARKNGYSTNTARYEYIRSRYREITGVDPIGISGFGYEQHINEISRVTGLSYLESKGKDKNAMRMISVEIGELGLDVVIKGLTVCSSIREVSKGE